MDALQISLVWIDIFCDQLGHESRNPLAFVHEELNLLAAQMMSKPARTSFFEEPDHSRLARLNSRSQPGCANIGNDSRGPGHPAGHHLNLDFLFRSLFRTRDSAFLAQAASAPSSGNKSRQAHQIRPALPGKSASRSERPAFGRRPGECAAGDFVSGSLVGRPVC